MAQADSSWTFTADGRPRSLASPCTIYSGQMSQGQIYIRVLNILLCQCSSIRMPHSFIRLPFTHLVSVARLRIAI